MLLSKLELYGFKSFPNKTVLNFDEGIMGVVGPNGCGKTNILDSLRWVLGEQRSAMLRGSKTEEVLFNGTTQLRSIDLAEVSLTIKNNRGVLPLEYDELVITRRLYRSGESEYLINKSRCRLKDIVNLFSDTGMGTHAYSILQQSMVDAVLSDKADERRFLFEEAAGISKYKQRKKESLKKLENTEIDLVRLSDIISEISRKVRSLKRQASKAKRYKKIKEELQSLETTRIAAQIYDFEEEIKNHNENISRLQIDKTGFSAETDKVEAVVEEIKLQISNMNEQISAKASIAADLSEKAIHTENKLSNIESSLKSGKQNVELWKNEIDNLANRIESFETQKNNAEVQRKDCSTELSQLQNHLSDEENHVDSIREKLEISSNDMESVKEELHRYENQIAADQARLDAANSSFERLKEITRDIDQSRLMYEDKKESSQKNLDQQKKTLKEYENEIEEIDEKIKINQRRHLEIAAEIEDIKKDIASGNAEKSAGEAKIEMLSRMMLEHEGYGSGVKSLFAWMHKPDGVIDTLANLITVEKQYYQAVEAAMGKYSQLAICQTRDDALRCIDYLKANARGRVGFLILDGITEPVGDNVDIKADGYLGNITDFVTVDDSLRRVVNVLFANMAVFEAGKIPFDCKHEAVDLEGNYFNRRGIIEGGKSSITLIGRKDELSSLENKLASIKQNISSLGQKLKESSSALSDTEEEASNLNKDKRTLLTKRESIISDITRLEFEFKDSIGWLDKLSANSSETDKQLESLNNQKAEIEKNITDKTTRKQGIAAEIQQKSEIHQTLQNDYDSAVDEFNKSRLKSVELSGLIRKLEEDSNRFVELIEEAKNTISAKNRMIDDEKQRWLRLDEEQVIIKEQIAKLFEAKDSINEDKDGLNNQKLELVEKLSEAETSLKQLRVKINNISEGIHQAELKHTDMDGRLKNTRENFFHEYGVHVTAEKSDDYNEEAITSQIERLESVVDKLGPVNMLADEEYDTEKDRFDFLEKQYQDLLDAKASLLDVIKRINTTAEEKFAETFELIHDNFKEVFQELFEGGTADVRLTDPNNLLETPIEIIARPEGKKLVSVNQLSGGERALTAIALLFSIYMVKPSPFCILDEIDAPLDDANVNRFLRLLHKFASNTQFIVITHNKKTMEAADLLYGITMEQPGVSSIVSVKLNGGKVEHVQKV